MASVVYNRAIYYQMTGLINLSTNGVRCALVSSGYTPDKDHDYWVAGSGPKDNEISGTGYVANGLLLTGKTLSLLDASDAVRFDANNTVWSGATFSARHAVLFVSNATLSNPLVACYDFSTDKTCSSGRLSITWSAAGLIVGSQT